MPGPPAATSAPETPLGEEVEMWCPCCYRTMKNSVEMANLLYFHITLESVAAAGQFLTAL